MGQHKRGSFQISVRPQNQQSTDSQKSWWRPAKKQAVRCRHVWEHQNIFTMLESGTSITHPAYLRAAAPAADPGRKFLRTALVRSKREKETCGAPGCPARLDKRLPDGKTQWHGRTEKVQNCAKKGPNVTSETGRKWRFWLQFPATAGSGWLLFPATAAIARAASAVAAGHASTSGCRTGKHHGTEGRRRFKIAPKKCLT